MLALPHVSALFLMIVRYHVVQEFNKGVYDYIIASDEGIKKGEHDSDESEDEQEEAAAEASDDECRSCQSSAIDHF
jgi:ATP-dependent RNA helicase DDX56/DBP9